MDVLKEKTKERRQAKFELHHAHALAMLKKLINNSGAKHKEKS
jgi:hypothetical protein